MNMQPAAKLEAGLSGNAQDLVSPPQPETTAQGSPLPELTELATARRALARVNSFATSGKESPPDAALLAKVEAVAICRAMNNIPQVAELLVDTMLTATNPLVIEAARESLVECGYARAQQALQLEHHLRDLAKSEDRASVEPINAQQIQGELATMTTDPVFVDRMIQHVTSGRSGSFYVAHALRETPLPEKQQLLRSIILGSLEESAGSRLRDSACSLPYALDPKHPETIRVLLKAADAKPDHMRNFEAAVIRSLGDIEGKEQLPVILRSFYRTEPHSWNVQRAAAAAVKAKLDESLRSEMVAIIDGSIIQSAWILAGKQGYAGLERVLRTYQFLKGQGNVCLHNKRTQAALALAEVHPNLAKRVLLDVTRGGTTYETKCEFYAGCDANRALAAMTETNIGSSR